MDWLTSALDALAAQERWPYQRDGSPAEEPTALAALALEAYGRSEAAERARAWLAQQQSVDGALGVNTADRSPHWPTALAVLAWRQLGEAATYQDSIERGIRFLLDLKGKGAPRSAEVGHDTTLIGWPWVEGTHSWVEPTAMAVLALKATGRRDHPRTREAVRLLTDRLLPTGGCNCGNTEVLGAFLRPHLEPSGLALVALADEADPDGRIERTIEYVRGAVGSQTTAASLAYGLMGLAAKGRDVPHTDAWLAESAARTVDFPTSSMRLALLALAARGAETPWIALTRAEAVS